MQLVIDIGAGTIDAMAPESEVVAAGAGEMLTMAVAESLGLPRAAADWVKRGPSVRVDAGQRYEAEDGLEASWTGRRLLGRDRHAGRARTGGTRRPPPRHWLNGDRFG